MILYFSSVMPYDVFEDYVEKGYISGSFQSQKFNNIVVTGLVKHKKIYAISNPPYNSLCTVKPEMYSKNEITYYVAGGHANRLIHQMSNIIFLFGTGRKLSKHEKVDYIISDGIDLGASLAALCLAKKLKVPAITIVTDLPSKVNGGNMNRMLRFDNWLMQRYSAYVLLTEQMNKVINPFKRPHIVMEGVCEHNEIIAEPKEKGKKILLYSGTIEAPGMETFIKAFVKTGLNECEFQLYGPGSYVPELKKICEEHNNIKYCGVANNAEVVRHQQNAALLVNPRPSTICYAEYSFPSKIMEYMASGTPVLTTKLPGIPEEYSDYLYWLEDETEEGMARKIRDVMNLPESDLTEMGTRARLFVTEEKNNVKQAKRIIELAESIKSGGGNNEDTLDNKLRNR